MATDYLLEIEGIKGESQDDKHKEKIEIHSFSWGVSNSSNVGVGTGGGTGKAMFSDLSFNKQMDKASPLLYHAAATGEHIKKAVLIARKAGGKAGQIEYMTITLTDVMVSSYQMGGHSGDNSIPLDSVSLRATDIKVEYKPQKADGSLEGAVTKSYNIAKNKGA
jgi:type VI secretion system secreted protein Hcp